jgi:lysophospholipase L1-like esterase
MLPPQSSQGSILASWQVRFLGKALISVAAFVVSMVIVDRIVGLVATPRQQVAHPPHHREQRTTSEYSYESRTNSQGLRSAEIPLAKPAGEFRAVAVGDSYTEGFGVRAEDTFCAVLERLVSHPQQPAHFVNAGLSGTGPVEYARVLFCVGIKYQPDCVLVALHANDLDGTPEVVDLGLVRGPDGEFMPKAKPLNWPPGSVLTRLASGLCPWTFGRLQDLRVPALRQQVQQLPFADRVRAVAQISGLESQRVERWLTSLPADVREACDRNELRFDFVAQGLLNPEHLARSLDVHDQVAERKWMSMRKVLSEIVAFCREKRVKVAVVYTPCAEQYDKTKGDVSEAIGLVCRRSEWVTRKAEIERRLESWADELSVRFLSLTETFREACRVAPGAYNLPRDGHWNPAGHRLAAEAIFAWLRDEKLIPLPSERQISESEREPLLGRAARGTTTAVGSGDWSGSISQGRR